MGVSGAPEPAPAPRRPVVVTGMGLVTPIGCDAETAWSAAVEGRSGLGPITRFDASDFPVRIAGEVAGFDPAAYMDRKLARRLPRFCQFALAAARMAMADAGLRPGQVDPERLGVLIGTSLGGVEELERSSRLLDGGYRRLSPFLLPMMVADAPSGVLAIECQAAGPNFAVVSACASGAHALGEAAATIERGDADVMLAGGTDAPITPLSLASACRTGAVSRRNGEPERALRPFDRDRDGFVMSEGAVVLVLEGLAHARSRGARELAVVAGYGATDDRHHPTAPEPSGRGAAAAMRSALARANVAPSEVGYLNAHGTATRLGDVAEAKAIREVFGEHARRLAVSSTKAVHGHLLGVAGAMEAALTILAVRHGVAPPAINLEHPDPECDLGHVRDRQRPLSSRVALSNSFGFGGHNASLVLTAPVP
jgi:3-oxoacyl-[acyl-carrier-protein] synthase II